MKRNQIAAALSRYSYSGVVAMLAGWSVAAHCASAAGLPADATSAGDSAARAADLLRKQNQDREADRQIDQLSGKQQLMRKPETPDSRTSPGWEGRSFRIRQIDLDNDHASPAVRDILAAYIDRDLGAKQIVEIVHKLDNHYAAAGYVTSIVTVPPQNLSRGKLTLHVEWGRVRQVTLNGRALSECPLRQRMAVALAMPGIEGSRLNIRAIDQMVENLSTTRKSVRVRIVPSARIDESDLDIRIENQETLQGSVGVDNTGSTRADGRYRGSLQLSTSDLLGLNDRLAITGGYRWFDHPDGSEENSVALNYALPIGFWTVEGAYSVIHTRTLLPTVFGTYHSKGSLVQKSGKLSRVLHRDGANVVTGWSEVLVRNNANFFEGQLIDVSSKSYTQLSLGITRTRILDGGYFYADMSWARGMPWFGGDVSESVNNGPSARYSLVRANVIWQRRQSLAALPQRPFVVTLRGGLQWTQNPLLNLNKFMFGDEYTVRGFKNDPFTGDKGVYASGTLTLPLRVSDSIAVSPRIGFDLGTLKNNQDPTGWAWATAVTAGADIALGSANLSLGVGVPVGRNTAVSGRSVLYLNASLPF